MSVIYPVSVRASRLQVVLTALSSATLQVGTVGMGAVLADIPLPNPPATLFSSNATLVFIGLPLTDVSANVAGTAAAAQFVSSSGWVVISGLTVGSSGTDLIISQVQVQSGDSVSFLSGTIVGN